MPAKNATGAKSPRAAKKQKTSSRPPALVIKRTFDAPRDLVWKVWSDPEQAKQWWGPNGFTLPFVEMDQRPGGKWRAQMRGPDGKDMWQHGVYREIVPPERIQYTESFDEWAEQGSALITTTLAERDGRTTLTCVSLAPSREVRDAVIRTGMEHGAAETYDRLADMLHSLREQTT